jgi:superfamily I DNA and/or RNA helicase
VELCVYLLRQGYKNNDITILTMYKGQMTEIQTHLSDRLCPRNSQNEKIDDVASPTPRVCSVDNYQGEECNIIILSLVRSNKMLGIGGSRGNIGFLKIVKQGLRGTVESQDWALHLWQCRASSI